MKTNMKTKMRLSLGKKLAIYIILLSCLLVGLASLFSYNNYADRAYEHYKTVSSNLAKTAAKQLNPDKMDYYLESKVKDDEYNDMLRTLYTIKDNNDIRFLYVIKIEDNQMKYIFDADKNPATRCELGETAQLHDAIIPYLDKLKYGVPGYVKKDDKYGWLTLSLEPVLNSNHEVVAMVGVDISMEDVMRDRMEFLLKLSISMISTSIIFIVIFILFIRKKIITPINLLSSATDEFVSHKNQDGHYEPSSISKLDINTGDEIENLSFSIKKMEIEINNYIENITKVTAEKERIGAELNVAKQIQSSLLPCIFPAFPEREEFDIYASMDPAREVGGDFYDFFMTEDRYLWMVMADVSDKGVAAALFMVISKTLIKNQAQFIKSPGDVFTIVNDQLCQNNQAGMFVTAFMGVLDIQTGKLTFANAGHNYPLIKKVNHTFEWLKSRPGLVLAGMEGIKYKTHELNLEPGDRLFLYTDGVTEALNPNKELYSDQRLIDLLNTNALQDISLINLLTSVKEDISIFASSAEQSDDITMLALEYKKTN